MLRARLAKRLGNFSLEVALEVPAGATLVLAGENGSGKTMTLRMVAGILEPDAGRIELGGRVCFDRESGIDVPAHRRPVGYVPQDYMLFPHLDVFENVAFGLRASGLAKEPVRARAAAALERFGVADLGARLPRQLSGGQQQRVALARALVLEPELLLLDEPLAALDTKARASVADELAALLPTLACATVYVTHSLEEAARFSPRVTVLPPRSRPAR